MSMLHAYPSAPAESVAMPDGFSVSDVRILALCDSPALVNGAPRTGFGRVARNVLNDWRQSGASIDVWAINFDGWGYETCPGLRLFPAGGRDWYSAKKLQGFIDRLATGDYTHVWLLMDIDAFCQSDFPRQFKAVCKQKGIRSLLYFPVDAAVEPEWAAVVQMVDVAVCYTEYGREQVRRALGKSLYPLAVLPHGVEDHFRVLPPEERVKYREIEIEMGGKSRAFVKPGDFLMLNVNKNEWRKDPFRSLEILKGLRAQGVPAKLLLRMAPRSLMGGVDLETAARQLGLKHGEEYFIVPSIPEENLVGLYNAADVYLTTTRGEGWGLGITEALACGCPVAMPLHTSCAEIERGVKPNGERGTQSEQNGPQIIPLLAGENVCGADGRVRQGVDCEYAVEAIKEFWRTRAGGPPALLSPAAREWLSWPRIAREMFGLLLGGKLKR